MQKRPRAAPVRTVVRRFRVQNGQRFLVDRVVEQPAAPISLIQNWKAPPQ
jgi:hypothetical protein